MKKSTKFLLGFVGGLLLSVVVPLRAVHALDTTVFDQATQVNVSTIVASPTQILPAVYATSDVMIMLNWSGSGTYPNNEFLLLSSSGTALSTSTTAGTFRIPAGNRPSDFISLNNYRGPLYGVVLGTTSAQIVSVMRKK